jgi:hypothetical protein
MKPYKSKTMPEIPVKGAYVDCTFCVRGKIAGKACINCKGKGRVRK